MQSLSFHVHGPMAEGLVHMKPQPNVKLPHLEQVLRCLQVVSQGAMAFSDNDNEIQDLHSMPS